MKREPILRLTKEDEVRRLQKEAEAGDCLCVAMDGARMQDKKGIMEEFAQRIPLPDYFGRNWDALEDCLRDPEVMGAKGCFLIIGHGELLGKRSPLEREALLSLLSDVSDHWRRQKPPVAFHAAIVTGG